MVKTCNVCKLTEETSDQSGHKLFCLPHNIISARNVLHNLGFKGDFIPTANFRICEKHFTSESILKVSYLEKFDQKKLRKTGSSFTPPNNSLQLFHVR